jgi:hypothetical protein
MPPLVLLRIGPQEPCWSSLTIAAQVGSGGQASAMIAQQTIALQTVLQRP